MNEITKQQLKHWRSLVWTNAPTARHAHCTVSEYNYIVLWSI